MRILFVVQESGVRPSGVVTVVIQLCKEWDKNDHITLLVNKDCQLVNSFHFQRLLLGVNVDVMTLDSSLFFDYSDNGVFFKIFHRPFRWIKSVHALFSLLLILHKQKFDGVLSHNGGWPGGILNRLIIYAAWLARVPKRVMVIHNTPLILPSIFRVLYHIYGRVIGWMTSHVITVSEDCCTSLKEIAGFSSVNVIYNGLSFYDDLYVNDSHASINKPPWNKKHVTVGFVGEIHKRKGIHVLVDALKYVNFPYELVVIGSGDNKYAKDVRLSCESLEYPTHFLGFRNDVLELYQWIDILVLPSIQYESFGTVIIEAMRNSIPVICSDFGGMKEVVVNNETGLVVKAGETVPLTDALNKLLNDNLLRVNMGQAGHDRMISMFNSQRMTEQYLRIFYDK